MNTKRLSRFALAAAMVLGFASFASQSAKADTIDDPTIEMGVSTGNTVSSGTSTSASEPSLSWTDSYSPGGNTNYLAFYYNGTTTTWTSVTIVATVSGTHTYSDEAYNPSDFANCSTCSATFTGTYFGPSSLTSPVTYLGTGGSVAPGEYLVVRYNNFVTSPDSTFAISVTGTGTNAPEPSSILLLGSGILALLGLMWFGKRRAVGITAA